MQHAHRRRIAELDRADFAGVEAALVAGFE
jgi:hypothetical protein